MSTSRPFRWSVAALAVGLAPGLMPLHPSHGAARRPAAEAALPPEVAEESLPIPPIPPDMPPAFSAAPVPDGDAAPTPEQPAAPGAHLGPGLFSQRSFNDGNGYLSGSTMQSEQDRKTPPAGLQLSMPLQ